MGLPDQHSNINWGNSLQIDIWMRGYDPVEIGQPSWRRVKALQEEENNEALAAELDLIDEVRVTTHYHDMATKQLIAARFNKKVKPRSFEKGDLVLRRADIGNKNANDGKLINLIH
ncbi:hypothetical protein K1719_034710 [Acacia pycnantha]|nr:hypothetical protein K1719_034710 [Acacia pycnantha]